MGLLRRAPAYDRNRVLRDAGRAESRRRRRKAIALYRQVLAVEPGDGEVHARIAPLLASTGQRFDAWRSYRAAGQARIQGGNVSAAIALYREATAALPRELGSWLSLARLLRQEGHPRDALSTLSLGAHAFRGRRRRPESIFLLRRAREIDPGQGEVVVALARLLAKTGQRPEALLLLRNLAQRSSGAELRRVRKVQLFIAPTPGNLWRWLRCPRGGPAARAVAAAPRP